MTTNELRIGNLVHCILLGTSKVLELRNDGISICSPDNNLNAYFIPNKDLHRIELIPLTEEWLLRMGLKEKPNHTAFHIGDMQFDCKTMIGGFHDNETGLEHQTKIHIKHVHQLQNLVYFLAGEELSVH